MEADYQVELLRVWPYFKVTKHTIAEFREIVENGDYEPADLYRIPENTFHKTFSPIKGYCYPVHPFFDLENLFAYRCARETLFTFAFFIGCIYFTIILYGSLGADRIEVLDTFSTNSSYINTALREVNFFFKHASWTLILIKVILLLLAIIFGCFSASSLYYLRIEYSTWKRKGPSRLLSLTKGR